jgi:ring-1,2-phenylacetyl-CoA epoxidase subunit PaaD
VVTGSAVQQEVNGDRHDSGTAASRADTARALVAAVVDPEIPVLTIDDLGILRDVRVGEGGAIEVTITPTYSGCPAMETITADVMTALTDGGFAEVTVRSVLAPAWTTDWMSDAGRAKLLAYGVTPPHARRGTQPVLLALTLRCPLCGSPDTRELSRFGSTACKSLWVCNACREPFDHFKAI